MKTRSPINVPLGYCRRCGYDLRGLSSSLCPECGARFDPADPSTFDRNRRSQRIRGAWRVLLILAALFTALSALAAFTIWVGWHSEQATVRSLNDIGPVATFAKVGPVWLDTILGSRFSPYLDRVAKRRPGLRFLADNRTN
jgi:hypothetical protein